MKASSEDKDTLFYVNDVQGNIMASYRLKNDSLFLVEQSLYGSSRIGVDVSNRLLWQRDTNLVYGTAAYNTVRGNKQYELTNHLGNVLATVSDKKVGVDSTNDGTYDYYNPVEITATDYYAYGGVLPERQYPKVSNCVTSKVLCTDTVFYNTFTNAYKVANAIFNEDGTRWYTQNVGTNLDTLTHSGSRKLKVSAPNTTYREANVQDSLPRNRSCTVTFDLHRVSVTTVRVYAYYYNFATSAWVQIGTYQDKSTNALHSFTFTTNSTTTRHRIRFQSLQTGASSYFLLDNVRITYSDSCTVVNCSDTTDGYVYGFNGKMKDNEVHGESGFYDYGERVSDTRINGGFLSGDPKKHLYPWNSPYINAENRPIDGFDANGEGWGDVVKLVKQKMGQIVSAAVSIAAVTTANIVKGKINDAKEKVAQKVGVEFADVQQVKVREVNANFSANVKIGPVQGTVKVEGAVGEAEGEGIGNSGFDIATRFKLETTTTNKNLKDFIKDPKQSFEGSGLQVKAGANMVLSDKPTIKSEANVSTSVSATAATTILGTGVEGSVEGSKNKLSIGFAISYGAAAKKPLSLDVKGKKAFSGSGTGTH